MRTTTILSALTLGTGRVGGSVFRSPNFIQDAAFVSTSTPSWLTIPKVHDKLVAARYRNVEKIERERTQGLPMFML